MKLFNFGSDKLDLPRGNLIKLLSKEYKQIEDILSGLNNPKRAYSKLIQGIENGHFFKPSSFDFNYLSLLSDFLVNTDLDTVHGAEAIYTNILLPVYNDLKASSNSFSLSRSCLLDIELKTTETKSEPVIDYDLNKGINPVSGEVVDLPIEDINDIISDLGGPDGSN